jgi:hypothetical protein
MNKFFIAIAMFCGLLNSGCLHNDDHDHDQEHDVPTTMVMTFTEAANPSASISATWEDIDGIGGNGPNRIDTIKLRAGVQYVAAVRVLNSNETPAEDLTPTIVSEGTVHQLFYTATPAALLTIAVTDTDTRSLPIGLTTTVTGTKGVGSLTVELMHYDSEGAKNGVDRSDETDLSVTLPVVVE